eukprot:CAMPEP_0117443070 /NCGR_PEP_ID=MMETSP0759-20121206/4496_1 /TAXON_ID=63605 /ORGANISM="Percolomonas cosmopolitus, Strain WS" /LENGTH=1282 /DNA_ID=CAMNT_0005235015 /DNA_START=636 /DNA_END=4484 /DNA_ORIENTATION=-
MKTGLKKMFDSDSDIDEKTVETFHQMKVYTKLHGHSTLAYKPVNNFFQLSKGNPVSTKGKVKPFCKGCIQSKSVKLATKFKRSEVPGRNEECGVKFGELQITSTIIMDNIMSFLSFPCELPSILSVHKSWSHYFTKCTDLSFVQHLYLTSKHVYPTISTVADHNLLKTNQEKTVEMIWRDSHFLGMFKAFSKCINFRGFPQLKSVSFNPVLGEQAVTDVSFLTLFELVNPKVFCSLSLEQCPQITWITLKKFFETCEKPQQIRLHGIEQTWTMHTIMNDASKFQVIRPLEHVHFRDAGKLPMTILAPFFKTPNLKHFGMVDSVLYWPKNRNSLIISPFEQVTSLDLTGSSMPLRNSLVEILQYFPGVEDLSVLYVQRKSFLANIKMFNRVGGKFLEDILGALEYRLFSDGELVVKKGEPGKEMFFVNRGEVEVIGDVGERLATLGKGEFFGELAILEDLKRTASIRALGTCELFSLDKASFFRVMRMHPESNRIIREEANARLKQLQQNASNSAPKKKKKLEEAVEEEVVKGDRLSIINAIYDMYPNLKSLSLIAKDLDLNLVEFFTKLSKLKQLVLALETSKESNLHSKPIEFGDKPLMLQAMRLQLEKSLYSFPPEMWLQLGKNAPELRFLHVDLPLGSESIDNIVSSFPRLQVLDVMNTPKAAKSIMSVLRALKQLTELRSDAIIFPEQVISALKKLGPHSCLRILDIPDSTWSDSQVVKACQACPSLQYLCVRTATMMPIQLSRLRKNLATAHLHVVLSVKKTKRNMMRTLTKAKLTLKSMRKKKSATINSSDNLMDMDQKSDKSTPTVTRPRSRSSKARRPPMSSSMSSADLSGQMRKTKSYAISLEGVNETLKGEHTSARMRKGSHASSNDSTPRLMSPSANDGSDSRLLRSLQQDYDSYRKRSEAEKAELMQESEIAHNSASLLKKEIQRLKAHLEAVQRTEEKAKDVAQQSVDSRGDLLFEENKRMSLQIRKMEEERANMNAQLNEMKQEIMMLKNGPQIHIQEASPASKQGTSTDLHSHIQNLTLENAMLKRSLREANGDQLPSSLDNETSSPQIHTPSDLMHDKMALISPMSNQTSEIRQSSPTVSPRSTQYQTIRKPEQEELDEKERAWSEEKKQLLKRLRKLSLLVKRERDNKKSDHRVFSSEDIVTEPGRSGSLAGRSNVVKAHASTLKPIKKNHDAALAASNETPAQEINSAKLFFERLKRSTSAGRRARSPKLSASFNDEKKKYLLTDESRPSPYQIESFADMGHPTYFAKILQPITKKKRSRRIKA